MVECKNIFKNIRLSFGAQFRIDDPSKTFWDDPNMYLDNADLDTLLSLSKDELLLGNNPDDTLVEAIDSDPNGKRGEKQWEVPNQSRSGKTNDWGKQVFACVYPNCSRSYRKPSHMKVIKKKKKNYNFKTSFYREKFVDMVLRVALPFSI